MTIRRVLVVLAAALSLVAVGCSVERLPVPSDPPATRVPSESATVPATAVPIETPWATTVDVPPDASTAEVLDEEPGSILVANPRDPTIGSGPGDFTGQPRRMSEGSWGIRVSDGRAGGWHGPASVAASPTD